MKKRTFSYNVVIIFWLFILLILISFILYVTTKIKVGPDINLQLIISAVSIILILLALYFMKMYLRFIRGDVGESDVSYILDKLEIEDRNYHHLSDFMLGANKGNIDSIVVGPTGIWSIEVKNQSEKVVIHDKYLDKQLNQTYAEKMELQNFLANLGINIPVTPVLVFANKRTRMNFGMRPINGVYVIGKKWLPELLTKHSTGYLSPEQCLRIEEQLKQYTSRI